MTPPRSVRLSRPATTPAPGEPPPDVPTDATVRPPAVPILERLTWGLNDLAALTGLSRRSLERARSGGRLPPPDLRVGKRVLWRRETIRRWIEGGGRS
jgi:hypothetical protein